jgi:hypothetical protein
MGEDHEARQESRHAMNMTPKWPKDRSANMQIFKDSTRKWRSLDNKIEALTTKETMSMAHMQVHANKESHKKQAWRKPGPNQAQMGLGRPAWGDQPNPFWARFDAPLT